MVYYGMNYQVAAAARLSSLLPLCCAREPGLLHWVGPIHAHIQSISGWRKSERHPIITNTILSLAVQQPTVAAIA